MDDKLKAALKRMHQGAKNPLYYAFPLQPHGQAQDDAARIVDGFLNEHPEDDDEWTTLDWLKSIGLTFKTDFGARVTDKLTLWDSSSGWHLFFDNGEGDLYMPDENTNGPAPLAPANTRGQVRKILAVFKPA